MRELRAGSSTEMGQPRGMWLRPVGRLAVLLLALSIGHWAGWAKEEAKPAHSAVTPVPREGGWMQRHELINSRAKPGDIQLLFLGDSITQGWESKDVQDKVWSKFYGSRKPMNAGIGGDRTQHVLWRLDHGNIDGISPKLAVIMIGTNNSNGDDNTAAEIADGIKAIVGKLQEKTPSTKILLLAIFPRNNAKTPEAREKQTKKINDVNSQIAKLDDGQHVFFKDIGKVFLDEKGELPKEVMPDLLHLSTDGYRRWAEAIEPDVARLLGEPAAEKK